MGVSSLEKLRTKNNLLNIEKNLAQRNNNLNQAQTNNVEMTSQYDN
jgi:hypothetical protein